MYYYIVNPAAGKGEVGEIQDKLKATLRELGIDGEFNKTIGPGDAAKITKLAVNQGFKTIVAIGGDQTVNEVIDAVYATRKAKVAVGIIPIGKQNLMARHLGIGNWQHACEVLASRRLQGYRMMTVNDKMFIYDCTLLAEGVWQEEKAEELPFWQTLISRPKSLAEQPFDYLIDLDLDFKARGRALQITVSNQRFLDTELGNQLIVHVYNSPESAPATSKLGSLLSRFKRTNASHIPYSQFHANQATIECRTPAEAIIDGQKIGGTKFLITLTDEEVQLITNRDSGDTLD